MSFIESRTTYMTVLLPSTWLLRAEPLLVSDCQRTPPRFADLCSIHALASVRRCVGTKLQAACTASLPTESDVQRFDYVLSRLSSILSEFWSCAHDNSTTYGFKMFSPNHPKKLKNAACRPHVDFTNISSSVVDTKTMTVLDHW